MKKLLSILGSIATVGTTGSMAVACKKEGKTNPKEDPIETSKKELKGTIDSAKEANNIHRKAPEAHKTLITEITIAEEILDRENVAHEDLLKGNDQLKIAINVFISSDDLIIIVRNELENKIKEAEELIINSNKTENAIKELKQVIEQAKKIWSDKEAAIELIQQETQTLEEAIEKFKASDGDISAKEKLQNRIDKANELVKLSEKVDEAVKKLEKETKAAEEVIKNEETTEEGFIKALDKLEEAIKEYNSADDREPRGILELRIGEAEFLLLAGSWIKPKEKVDAFRKAIDIAQKVYDDETKTDEEIRAAIIELNKAINEFGI